MDKADSLSRAGAVMALGGIRGLGGADSTGPGPDVYGEADVGEGGAHSDGQHFTTYRYLCWLAGAGPTPFR